MARIRVQRQTRQCEPPTLHCLSLSLETRLANVVRRHVASCPAPMVLCAGPTATRRGTKNSSPVRARPIPRCPAKIYPCRLVSLSVYQTGWTRLVDAHLCGGILAANDSAQWLNGVAPALMSGSHLHLFWLQGFDEKIAARHIFWMQHPRTQHTKM